MKCIAPVVRPIAALARRAAAGALRFHMRFLNPLAPDLPRLVVLANTLERRQ